jgi:hypothetical protein
MFLDASTTTRTTTGFDEIRRFARLAGEGKWTATRGGINIGLAVFLLVCVAVILSSAVPRGARGPRREPAAAA